MMPLAFLAGPFRAATGWGIEQHVRRAEEAALRVWQAGAVAVVPHLLTRHFHGEVDEARIADGYLRLLSRCDVIVMLDGWGRSAGSLVEHEAARAAGMPICYGIEEFEQWLNTR